MGPRLEVDCDGPISPLPAQSCRLWRRLGWPAGQARVALPPGVAAPARGTSIRLQARGPRAEQRLFTGIVLAVSTGPSGSRLDCSEPAGALAGSRRDASWEATSADAVVRELAADADVPVGTLAPGALLPQYTMLRERSVLEHCLTLAERSGCDCWSDADGRLQMTPTLPTPGATLLGPERAAIRVQHGEGAEPPGSAVVGTGALGSAGPGSERWPVLEPPTAGAADAAEVLRDAALVSIADVERAQLGRAQRLREAAAWTDLSLAEVIALDLNDVVLLNDLAGVSGPARIGALAAGFDGIAGFRLSLRLWRLAP